MYSVKCPNPNCPDLGEIRYLKTHQNWMEGPEPFSHICKKCCQKGKEKSEETKAKLSESGKAAQTPELRKKKSEFMKNNPELWQANLQPELGPLARIGTHHTEESKDKISQSLSGVPKTQEHKDNISKGMKGKNKKHES